ncbi:MAG: GNAT family N-acetyltransferase [Rhizobiaceae bacterium]
MWVRTASQRDAPAIQKLLADVWHSTYDAIYGREKVTALTADWHKTDILQQQMKRPNSEFLVVDDGKTLSGMAYGRMKNDTELMLHQLYVSAEHHGKGQGGNLLNELLSCFPEAKIVTLQVDVENTGAIEFYKKFGFEKTGTTENCGKEDSGIRAIMMTREL